MDSLAPNKRGDTREISTCGSALVPHAKEEVGRKVMDLGEVEKERLEGCRCRIFEGDDASVTRLLVRCSATHTQVRKRPNAQTTSRPLRLTPSQWGIAAQVDGSAALE